MVDVMTDEIRVEKLVDRFQSGQRLSILIEIGLLIASLVFVFAIDWNRAWQEWMYSLVVLGLVPLQLVPGWLMVFAEKKKSIDLLSESSCFGPYRKRDLRSIVDETVRDLNLPVRHVKVFLTASKELNAAAVSVGLMRLLPTYRGIYLNRKTLHMLHRDELRSVIGHELGHLFPYALRLNQTLLLQLVCGALLSLFILQMVGNWGGLGIYAAAAVAAGFLFLLALPRSMLSQPIEYLCDAYGARASGVNAAITELLKTGSESTAAYELAIYAMELGRDGKTISERDAMRVYEASLGFEPTDVERNRQRIDDLIRQRKVAGTGGTLRGLIDFFWNDPSADSSARQQTDKWIRQFHELQKLPMLDWKAITQWTPDTILEDDQIERLVEQLEAFPDHVLYPMTHEIQTSEALSHPSIRNRVLFLWRQRKNLPH